MPAVSMSVKLRDHQKSLLCRKQHVAYINLHGGIWQLKARKKKPLELRNKCIYLAKLSIWLQRQLAGFLWYLDYDFN